MAARRGYRTLAQAALVIGFGWLAILIEIAPLRPGANGAPSPDILFAVCAYMALKRPETTPAWAILALGLARDLAAGAPVGLGALTLLLSVEALRAFADRLSRRAWGIELAAVAAVALAALTAQTLVLALTFTPIPALDVLVLKLLYTALVYPSVTILFRWVLRIGPERRAGARP